MPDNTGPSVVRFSSVKTLGSSVCSNAKSEWDTLAATTRTRGARSCVIRMRLKAAIHSGVAASGAAANSTSETWASLLST